MSNSTNLTRQSVKQLYEKALEASIDTNKAISIAKSRSEELKSSVTNLNTEQQEVENALEDITHLEIDLKKLRENWAAHVEAIQNHCAPQNHHDCMTEHAVRENIHTKTRDLSNKKEQVQDINAARPAAIGHVLTEMQALEDPHGNIATLHQESFTKSAEAIDDAIILLDVQKKQFDKLLAVEKKKFNNAKKEYEKSLDDAKKDYEKSLDDEKKKFKKELDDEKKKLDDEKIELLDAEKKKLEDQKEEYEKKLEDQKEEYEKKLEDQKEEYEKKLRQAAKKQALKSLDEQLLESEQRSQALRKQKEENDRRNSDTFPLDLESS